MAKVTTIMKKNLKLILSNKKAYFMIFIVPIILFFIIGGVFYTNSSYNIKIGIVGENNEIANEYYSSFEEKGFSTFNYTSKEECLLDIEKEQMHMCLSFGENTSDSSIESFDLELHVDNTKGNLIEIGKNVFSNVIDSKTQNLKDNYTKQIFEIFELIKENSYKQKDLVDNISNIVLSFENQIELEEGNVQKALSDESGKIVNLKQDIDKYILARKNLVEFIEKDLEQIEEDLNDTLEDLGNESSEYDDFVDIQDEFYDVSDDIFFLKSEMPEYKKLIDRLEQISNSLEENTSTEVPGVFSDLTNLNDMSKERIDEALDIINKIEEISKSLPQESLAALANPINLEVIDYYSSSNINSKNSQITNNLHIILSIVISFLATILTSTFIYTERFSDAYLRNIMSTVSSLKFISGNFLSLFIILYAQIFVVVLIFNMFYMKLWNINFAYLLFSLIFIISCFIFIGMFIGLISNNLNSNFITSFFVLFLMFIFSNSVVPLEVFSQKFIDLLYLLNPYLVSQEVIRKIFLSELTLNAFFLLVTNLIQWIIGLFLVCLFLQSFDMKKISFFLFSRLLIKVKKYAIKIPFGKYMAYLAEYLEQKFKI